MRVWYETICNAKGHFRVGGLRVAEQLVNAITFDAEKDECEKEENVAKC